MTASHAPSTHDENGIDRTLIREMLALSPTQRIARLTKDARFVKLIERAGKQARASSQTARLRPES